MKKGYCVHIEEETLRNELFRKVVYTGAYSQLVLMSIPPKGDIGVEVHEDTDQFFRFDAGQGIVTINGVEHAVSDGDAVVVPAGAEHNVSNTSDSTPLKLYTIYSPSHHRDGTVHATKVDAQGDDEQFDGTTSE